MRLEGKCVPGSKDDPQSVHAFVNWFLEKELFNPDLTPKPNPNPNPDLNPNGNPDPSSDRCPLEEEGDTCITTPILTVLSTTVS